MLMSFAPLTGLGVYAAGRRWFSPAVGCLAAIVYLSTPWVYRISIIALTEGASSFYLMTALLAVVISMRIASDGGSSLRPCLLLAGFLAGSAWPANIPRLSKS